MARRQTFSKNLISWYRKNKRDLPWRKTKDPYKIWVSEIMLQQTTVKAVVPYYKKWLKVFPTVKSVALAREQHILKMWQGLGYYQRAKNLHKSAKIILKKFHGKLHGDSVSLKALPGFGDYTVGAVLSIAFNKRQPVIDANVRRVIMRVLSIEGRSGLKNDKEILEFLQKIIPAQEAGDFNQALMELGALICRSKEPICNRCPVKFMCRAYEKDIQEIIPFSQKKVIKKIKVAIAVIEREGKYFIQKRSSKGLLADMWEFPGGKIKKEESPLKALKREIKEELGIRIDSAKHFMNAKHYYTQFCVELSVWRCTPKQNPICDESHIWTSRKNLNKYPMPSGSAKILDSLIKHQ